MPYDPNWKTNPKIQAAKDFCVRFGEQQVIVIGIDGEGNISGNSYGAGRQLCSRCWII